MKMLLPIWLISAKDLYKQWVIKAKSQGIQEEQTPSLLWFRFQFWSKNPCIHSAMNYTGPLKVWYMVLQCNIQKYSDGDHYCNAIYKYAREMKGWFNSKIHLFKVQLMLWPGEEKSWWLMGKLCKQLIMTFHQLLYQQPLFWWMKYQKK